MATSNPFDVRVVNPLERPTSTDFNVAQAAARTSVQTLAELCLDMRQAVGSPYNSGFIDSGFVVSSKTPSGMAVQINPGIGFAHYFSMPANTNIGGVPGLDVFASAPTIPIVLTTPRTIPILTAPLSGFMRRDIVAVKTLTSTDALLSDQVTTDIFNPLSQVFAPSLRFKTLGWCLDDVSIEVLPEGGAPSATEKLLYIPGTEQPYSEPNDLLTYTLPTVPSGFTVLAVVNVVPGTTSVEDNCICDYRPLYFPTRSIAIPIEFIGGAKDGVPGDQLLVVNVPTVRGMRGVPIVTKTGLGTSNRYGIVFPGIINANRITGVFTAGGDVYDGNIVNHTFANIVTTTSQFAAADITNGPRISQFVQTNLADPNLSSPTNDRLAIGQPYSIVTIALGYVDLAIPGMNYQGVTFDSTGTETRTISGTITLSY